MAITAAVGLAGCASANPPYNLSSWFNLGRPNLTSFLGVRFGASPDRVRRQLPDGMDETSPLGASAWRVNNVESGGVRYSRVIFEFADGMGMQLAVAEYRPQDGAAVLSELTRALGQPTSQRAVASTSGTRALVAIWELPHRERITVDGGRHQVEMLGPGSFALRHDAALRRQGVDSVR